MYREGNALQAASYSGHEAIVKLLVDECTDMNAQGGYYRNALKAALGNYNVSIIRFLLDGGAEVNTQGGHYGNADSIVLWPRI